MAIGFATTDKYVANFDWRKPDGPKGYTVWRTFKEETTYFQPSAKEMMINYRAENLEDLLNVLQEEGVTVADEWKAMYTERLVGCPIRKEIKMNLDSNPFT